MQKPVPANIGDSREFGMVTFFGNVDKQISKTTKFHHRWVVLRGLYLYWYREPVERAQKDTLLVPTTSLTATEVNGRVSISPKLLALLHHAQGEQLQP